MWTEISGRLEDAVKAQVPFADRLKPALALACKQLELLSPGIMGATSKGFVAGLATPQPVGTCLIVLASPRKVLTMHILAPAKPHTRLEIFENCRSGVLEVLGRPLTEGDVVKTIELAVDEYGGKPGQAGNSPIPEVLLQIVGVLFSQSPLPRLMAAVEETIAENVCPLFVGLIGEGTKKDTVCGAWPLFMPFVPYVDALLPAEERA